MDRPTASGHLKGACVVVMRDRISEEQSVTSVTGSDSRWAQPSVRFSSISSRHIHTHNVQGNDDFDEFELSDAYIYKTLRWLRWNFFSAYRRLFTIVFFANLAVFLAFGAKTVFQLQRLRTPRLDYSSTLTAASVNFALSILLRNEHVVNMLFLLSTSVRPSAPLILRRMVAKIYGYGGIHSGCATAAVTWYLGFAALVAYHIINPPLVDRAVAITTCVNVTALLTIVIFAHPTIRSNLHDWFECIHRFVGWLAVAIFWTQLILMASIASRKSGFSIAEELVRVPAFWCLIAITACIAYPWTRLRRRSCTVEPLSEHAIRLHFTHSVSGHSSAVRLATNPLKQTHAFAAIPNADHDGGGNGGFSTVISNAGDWTSGIITKPPGKIWIKGAPTYGVLRVALIFKPVLLVATGSGIGPCLSIFHGAPELDCRVLWSTRSPLETYGGEILSDVLKADPTAVIVDTEASGRPDLVRLTYDVCKKNNCEAVVVISNPRVTREIVYGMETRGVPAYGPIFDS